MTADPMSDPTSAAPDPVVERLRLLDTCAVSDALDTLGLPGATTGIGQLWPVARTVAGRARTVTAGPRTGTGPVRHIAAAAIDASGPGDVLVIANGGRTDVSCFGGILAVAALRRGIDGVVIDGACRDIAESQDLGLPMFGRAVVAVSARRRIVQLAMDQTVTFAGVEVASGDLVLADRNGVVFLPDTHAGRLLDLAERIVEREAAMAEAVRDGQPVDDVMHDSRFPTVEEAAR